MGSGDEKLLETIGLSPVASVISNPRRPDNPIEVANSAFCRLTPPWPGCPPARAPGRT